MTPILTASMLSVMSQPTLADLETVQSDLPLAQTAHEMEQSAKALGALAGPLHQDSDRAWVEVAGIGDEALRMVARRRADGSVWITFRRLGAMQDVLCA